MKPGKIIVCLSVVIGVAAYVMTGTITGPNAIRAICMDGTVSTSKKNKGTCAKHGGVARWTNE